MGKEKIIMAKKTKGFRELLKQQRNPKYQKPSQLRQFRTDSPDYDRSDSPDEVAISAVSMSEVLEYFVEPYFDSAPTTGAKNQLLTLAMLAWNMTLCSPSKQQEMMAQITQKFTKEDEELRKETQNFVEEIMVRKNLYFAEYKRKIIDFDLKDTEIGYHLAVISTIKPVNEDDCCDRVAK